MVDIETEWAWPYVEALPRFYARRLAKAFRSGARLIYWYDEDGALVGSASFDINDTGINLAYAFDNAGDFIEACEDVVHLDALNRIDRLRFSRLTAICPKCRRNCEMLLFFERAWLCAKCHDVKNLSNSLDQQTNQYQKMMALDKRVGSGRPIGMHHVTYARQKAELKQLKAEWGRAGARTLRSEQQLRVNEHYFKQGEAPYPTEPEPIPARHSRKRRSRAVKPS